MNWAKRFSSNGKEPERHRLKVIAFGIFFLLSCTPQPDDPGITMIRNLVSSRADLNFVMENQYTPLTYSIRYGQFNLVKTLLVSGTDPDFKDALIGSPLTVASLQVSSLSNPRPELITILLQYGADPKNDGSQSLRLLARSDYPQQFLAVLGAGADPFILDDENRSLLHQCALGKKNKAIWSTLIRLGLDPKRKDNDGFLALDYWQNENL